MWDTCTSYFGPKKLIWLAGGVREGQNIAQNGPRFWLWSPLEAPKWVNGSRTPEMDSNQSGAVGGIIWGPFQGGQFALGIKDADDQTKTTLSRCLAPTSSCATPRCCCGDSESEALAVMWSMLAIKSLRAPMADPLLFQRHKPLGLLLRPERRQLTSPPTSPSSPRWSGGVATPGRQPDYVEVSALGSSSRCKHLTKVNLNIIWCIF